MTENKKMPDDCIGCRACERKCPQNIKISEIMKDLSQKIKESINKQEQEKINRAETHTNLEERLKKPKTLCFITNFLQGLV